MPSDSQNNKRIAQNTLLLYFRMLFLMLVSLYTSRVNLNALGIEDFGIYNVVGGLVAMFSIISGSLVSSISRFITFELGTENKEKLKKVFSTAVSIQFFSYYTIALFKVQAKATDAFTSHLNLTTYQILCCRLHHLLFYHI